MASTLVTADDYVRITGDDSTDTDTVEATIDDMLAMIEEEIDRTLLFGQYTETLPLSDTGHAYPRAVPVSEISASSSGEVWDEGWSLRGLSPDPNPGPFMDLVEVRDWVRRGVYTTVTYSGGYTYDTFPKRLRRLICRLALVAIGGGGSQLIPGTTQASVGDVSVQLATGSVGSGELDVLLPGTCSALTSYRRPVYN